MSQNSIVLPTTGVVSGLQMTQNTNAALDTLNTLSSGASAPASPSAGQWWHDTTNNLLNIRSLDNAAWIAVFSIDESGRKVTPIITSADAGGFKNKFRNGTFDIAQRGTAGTVPAGSVAYTLDGWMVGSTGATTSWSQAINNSNGTFYELALTGNAGVTDTYVRQRIESYITAVFDGKQVTVQFIIYNNTGASITPALLVRHANAQDNWGTFTTDVNGINLQACPNGTATTVAYTFAASGNSHNGLEVLLDFGGVLTTNAKTVAILAADIRVTQGVGTGLNATPPAIELRPYPIELAYCQRYFYGTFPTGTIPAQNAGLTGSFGLVSPAAANFGTSVNFPVPMRATPTLITYNPSAANANWRDNTNNADRTFAGGPNSANGIFLYGTSGIAGADNRIHFIASAEL